MRVAHLNERGSRRLLDVVRLDFYRAKLIRSATVGAFHGWLEWSDAKGDASNFSLGVPPLRIACTRKNLNEQYDNELWLAAYQINLAPVRM
jgi:hypothetical protein